MSTEGHHPEHEEGHREGEGGVDLPIPTAWPITAALGITLIALGLVTSLFISLVGFLMGLLGAVGWFRDVFPVPKHLLVPLVEQELRAAPVKTSQRQVNQLKGEALHRAYYPIRVHRYSSGIFGGLAGGAAMAILAMLYGQVVQHSIWYPINLLAAAGVPSLATANLETLREFSASGFFVAVISHGAISILVGLLYTVLLPMLPARYEWFWGGIMVPLIWTGLMFPLFNFINPALAARVDWLWFVICQVSFGVVGGFVVFKSQKIETMQTWPMAARLGVHAIEREENQ
ncbi:MAG: hypothetical protein WB586_09040 [Chthoniobacterales bacterium]